MEFVCWVMLSPSKQSNFRTKFFRFFLFLFFSLFSWEITLFLLSKLFSSELLMLLWFNPESVLCPVLILSPYNSTSLSKTESFTFCPFGLIISSICSILVSIPPLTHMDLLFSLALGDLELFLKLSKFAFIW